MMDFAPTGALLGQTRVVYEWLRLEQLDQWWHWALLASITVFALVYSFIWYRRDAAEHFRPIGWALLMLRIVALAGLLLYFMQLDKRSEQRVVRPSRVAILLDTSMSMSLPGTPTVSGVANSNTRAQEVANVLERSEFLDDLVQDHEARVYAFDEASKATEIAALPKLGVGTALSEAAGTATQTAVWTANTSHLLVIGMYVIASIAAVCLCVSLGAQVIGFREWYAGSWFLLVGSWSLLASMVLGALAVVPQTDRAIADILGLNSGVDQPSSTVTDEATETETDVVPPEDWDELLAPAGVATRLGDALKSVLEKEASYPLAGIVVVTDGRSNAGLSPTAVLALAQANRVPLYVVGVGSERSPKNLELVEIDVPKRLYPGDRFGLKALVGGSGFEGSNVTVQILSGVPDASVDQMGIEAEQIVRMPDDGALANLDFPLEPKVVGTWKYAARVIPLTGDAIADDNMRETVVEVVERKNRVLVAAGGPTRDYQFVRNLLFRDRDVESHVYLQTGSDRSSQEAQVLVNDFPADLAALSEYDAVIAFDLDWTKIGESSVVALERWVGEQAGGFVMVAGSVEMPKWLARSASSVRARNLQDLAPVVLERRGSALLAAGRIEGESAWPLTLTADGKQMEFLWVTDEPESSRDFWQDFSGVHSYYAAYELKPGAKAHLLFSDPSSAIDGQLPVYVGSQYYGAGRTVFVGGGEMWRIRGAGDQYFDRLYTKMIRWVSQGRLLLDSNRGVLLVDRQRALLGDQVLVRAVLKNEQFEPLVQSEVVARLIDPNGLNTPFVLRPLSSGARPGVYSGQFPVLKPGDYEVQLQLGGLASEEILSASVQAKVPALEMQRAERDDVLLRRLATESGGRYWKGADAAFVKSTAEQESPMMIDVIEPLDQVAYLPGAPDQEFQLRWLGWLMVLIAGCLSLEWLTRRLHRLA